MADLKHQINIDAKPEKVYAALATQAGLRSWWTADTKADEKVGGKAEFGFDKRGMVFRMKIEKLDPAKRVVWSCHGDQPEWNGTTLTWDLVPNDHKTTLRFTHSGWKAATEMYVICNSSWGELMYRLKNYVEGKKPGPLWKEYWTEARMPKNQARETVEQYFTLWSQKDYQGSRIHLADDLQFRGPFDTFHRADDFIRAVSRLGPIVKEIRMGKIFSEDHTVCIIYEMVTSTEIGTVPIAEVFEVGSSGKITSILAFFDPRPFVEIFT